MRRDVMETIAGIEIFPIISLIIFVGFFAMMLYWVIRLDDTYMKNENLPLGDDNSVADSNLPKQDINGELKHGS